MHICIHACKHEANLCLLVALARLQLHFLHTSRLDQTHARAVAFGMPLLLQAANVAQQLIHGATVVALLELLNAVATLDASVG